MSKITAGKIITRREDIQRDVVWEALRPLRLNGYERGVYRVELEPKLTLRIEVGAKDLALIEQMDELLDRILEGNHKAAVAMTGCDDQSELLAVAWFALNPVRLVGYGDGEYSVKIPGGFVLRYSVTSYEALLLQQCDEVLSRIATENKESLDRALSEDEDPELEAA